MARTAALTSAHICSRIAASLLGSWAFVWGFVTLGISAGVALGLPYAEASMLLMLLAFIVFLAAFCWTFAAASIARVWAVLCGGGAVMTLLAWCLSRALV